MEMPRRLLAVLPRAGRRRRNPAEIQRNIGAISVAVAGAHGARSPLRIARTVSAPAVVQSTVVVVFPNEGVLITCQALVRGRRVRAASYRRSPPLWSVRKRADAAAKKATPSATLGARCRKALAFVESGARLEDVRGACAALESSLDSRRRVARRWRLLTGRSRPF